MRNKIIAYKETHQDPIIYYLFNIIFKWNLILKKKKKSNIFIIKFSYNLAGFFFPPMTVPLELTFTGENS